MKKRSLLTVMLLCVSLSACGSTGAGNAESSVESSASQESSVEASVETEESVQESAPEESSEEQGSTGGELAEGQTVAGVLYENFKAAYAEHNADAQAITDDLAGNEVLAFMVDNVAIEEDTVFMGFSDNVGGYEKAYKFGPMIGSIPFIGYVFEAADEAAADALMADLKAKADLRWNICTSADEMLCEREGNIVFFVMSPLKMEE